MILRSGDILIMGGKSRLRVHAVPKVFTKSLPPTYLHPRTAGSQRIHMEDCTCFLKRHLSTMDCVDSSGASGSDLLITTCQKRYSIECFDNQETKIWSKRQRSASIGESLTENVTLEENKKCEKETYVRNNRNNEQCSCNSLSIQGEVRALRYLQTTRININVRQVYSNTKL